MLGYVRLTPTTEGAGNCLFLASYSSDLEHVILWNYSQRGSRKERVRRGFPALGTSASWRKHKRLAAAAAKGKQRRKSPKSRAGAEGEQSDSRCGASERRKIILWSDGTKGELIGHIGQKYDDL